MYLSASDARLARQFYARLLLNILILPLGTALIGLLWLNRRSASAQVKRHARRALMLGLATLAFAGLAAAASYVYMPLAFALSTIGILASVMGYGNGIRMIKRESRMAPVEAIETAQAA